MSAGRSTRLGPTGFATTYRAVTPWSRPPTRTLTSNALRSPGAFHIVIIEDLYRSRRAIASVPQLESTGVLSWNNSNRLEFGECFPDLKQEGFKRIDFNGVGARSVSSDNSIVDRSDKCLQI